MSAAAIERHGDPNGLPVFELRAVTPGFFRTFDIQTVAGRAFSDPRNRALVAGILLCTSVAAALIPTLRALRADAAGAFRTRLFEPKGGGCGSR